MQARSEKPKGYAEEKMIEEFLHRYRRYLYGLVPYYDPLELERLKRDYMRVVSEAKPSISEKMAMDAVLMNAYRIEEERTAEYRMIGRERREPWPIWEP